jgi:hypothetical protein
MTIFVGFVGSGWRNLSGPDGAYSRGKGQLSVLETTQANHIE